VEAGSLKLIHQTVLKRSNNAKTADISALSRVQTNCLLHKLCFEVQSFSVEIGFIF
jgi:hypothetical protein